MNAVVIYAHPNPVSFVAAVVTVVEEGILGKGAQVKVKDLYGMNFNPVLGEEDFRAFHTGNMPEDIRQEQEDIAWADLVVMISPVWWYSVPAMLKGYIDRVFSLGFAYEYTSNGPRGMLTGKKGLLITTSGADEKTAKATGMLDAIENSLVKGLFGFSGFAEYRYKNLFAVPTVSDTDRKQMLAQVRELIKSYT
ncbi:MAG TPA: NAD(P)H-dependent oxidoreductase [Syntrophomonadaceae bacterium]|nr:NAD(P)H-dependent oxidoreductase [Syntrophomonadaceae bacterium]